MDNTKTNNIKLIIIITVIIVFMLSSTYAFIEFSAIANTTSTEAGCFEVNYTAQEINASALVSTTNYLEGAKSEVVLSKAEDCEIYNEASIYIHTNASATTAPINDYQALKYKVLNSSNTVLSEGAITTTDGTDVKIATVPLTTTATTYSIYIWVDSDISQGNYNETTYSGYIYAESIQTSTIK